MCKLKYSYLLLCISLFFLISCKQSDNIIEFNAELDPIVNIAMPISLQTNNNIIDLNDFILDFSDIDSVYYQNSKFSYNSINHTLEILEEFTNIKPLSTITIIKDGNPYNLICKKCNKISSDIIFTPQDDMSYESVSIAGSFNNWNPEGTDMIYKEDKWMASLTLDQGLFQYQIVADNNWMNNYPYGDTVSNGIGGYNTILNVRDRCETIGFNIQTTLFENNSITITSSYIPDGLFIFWQNQIIPLKLENYKDMEYSFEIPKSAKDINRSYIRIYAYYGNCISNDLLIPLNNGKPVENTTELTRSDKHLNIMYFILVDRFKNGDKTNDAKIIDNRVHAKANYQGGDIAGIQQKLKDNYFDELGINCLWISPIFQNPTEAYQEFPEPRRYYSGYHGYWPISSTDIDFRFGNDSIFKELVNSAHSKNTNVILDFVANHVHENHPLYQDNKDWATKLKLEDGRLNIRIWEEERLTTWFDTFLPSWNFVNPEVSDTISEYAMYWLNNFNLDGFRHDATKHIPESFWQTLTRKIKNQYPDKSIIQIGETFGSRELMNKYINTGMLDGQFDFNLYFDARNCFANEDYDMSTIASSLLATLNTFGHHNLMGNITGNHDLIRFITLADKSVLPGEDDKEAGWDREIVVKNASSYKKLQNLAAFIMTIPGIPCIYYGDEIGMPGAGDPDNRRMMIFESLSTEEQTTFEVFKKLISIRKTQIEFIYGTTSIISSGRNHLIIKRKYFNNESYIFFNNSNKAIDIQLNKNNIGNINDYEQHFNTKITELDSNYQFRIEANSFEILSK